MSKQTRADIPFALVVTGFGIGWRAGLSVSPMVSIVISSVLGTIAALVKVATLEILRKFVPATHRMP